MAVYFVQNPDTGHIKIGKSFMVQKRVGDLSRNEGVDLELLGVIKGYSTEEADLHLYFSDIRLHGEWFGSTSELIQFIVDHAIPLCDLTETRPLTEMVLFSKIKSLAETKNLKTPQDLSHELKISWITAKQLWDGDVSNTRLGTMFKVANLFDCKIDDLFEAS